MKQSKISQMAIKDARRSKQKNLGLEFSNTLFENTVTRQDERVNMLRQVLSYDD